MVDRDIDRLFSVRQTLRINHQVADSLALPCIGYVHGAIGGLDDGWIGVFSVSALQQLRRAPRGAIIMRHGQMDRVSSLRQVIVYEEQTPVAQSNDVDTGIGIGKVGGRSRGPGSAPVG